MARTKKRTRVEFKPEMETYLKDVVLPKSTRDKRGLRNLKKNFNDKFGVNYDAFAIYRKAKRVQGGWTSGSHNHKPTPRKVKEKERKKHNYTPDQKQILKTCDLPKKGPRSRKIWTNKLNKILGTKDRTYDALMYQAKTLRNEWGGHKANSTSQKVNKKVSSSTSGWVVRLTTGEDIWTGDHKPTLPQVMEDKTKDRKKDLFEIWVENERVWSGSYEPDYKVWKEELY